MLLRSIDLLIENPLDGLVTVIVFLLALVVAITFHEFCHALSANLLGDLTATRQGRLSINPVSHLDPMGSVMILLAGFGWGKPVPVNAYNLMAGVRSGMALVAAAGPISNVVLAIISTLPIRIGLVDSAGYGFVTFGGGADQLIGYFLQTLIGLNLVLAAFNLIPIAPLDGFKIALGVLPRDIAEGFRRLEPHGPMILLGLIFFDYLIPGRGILAIIIEPIFTTLATIVLAGHS